MFEGIRKQFTPQASERDGRPEVARWYPTPVEVPRAEPTYGAKIDSIIEFLRVESVFEDERTFAVDRAEHEAQCLRLLAKCFGVICLLKIKAKTPLGEEGRDYLKALMEAVWAERREEVRAIVPIWQETTPGLH